MKVTSNAASNQSLFVSDFDTKTVEKQYCEKCNPQSTTMSNRRSPRVCADCSGETMATATAIFNSAARPKKVVKLHQCSGCGNYLAATKFSIYYGVCKKCLRDAKRKSKLGQSNFIERTLNTMRRNLRGALTDV
jgi:hypothetical protein